MKLIHSPLQLKKFNLLQYEFKLILSESNKKINIKEDIFPKYVVDVNFAWKKNNDGQVVFCKLEINRVNEKEIGYSIVAEGMGIFKLEENTLEADAKNLITYSAPSIVLQELRALIRNNTFIAPHGAYVLPTINIQAQIRQKIEALNAKKLPVKKTPAKKSIVRKKV